MLLQMLALFRSFASDASKSENRNGLIELMNRRNSSPTVNQISRDEFGKRAMGKVGRPSLSVSSSLVSALLMVLLGAVLSGCKFQFGLGYNQGYAPEQPIPFDHSLHVKTHQIQCQYCHNQVERSNHSNIPALSTCMNCHLVVKTDSPHIQKMREAYDKGESIPWVKVHMLPDHVKFSHNAHIAKGVNCQTCHGEVEKMQKVYQHSDLSMGWCVNCHRESENKAPINCSTCHH